MKYQDEFPKWELYVVIYLASIGALFIALLIGMGAWELFKLIFAQQ